MDEHGNTSPGYDALRAALGRIVGSLPTKSPGTDHLTPERMDLSLTSGENFRPGTESVYLRARSSVPNARNSRVAIRAEETSKPPLRGLGDFGLAVGENGERQASQAGEEQILESGNFLPDPAFEKLLHQMNMDGDHLGNEERGGNHDISENVDAGNFRYLSSSQTQVSPVNLPERFRAGRESLSVVRNVTIRDSKRLKPRTRDDEYKRRVSISPSTMPYFAHHSSGDPNVLSQHLRLEQANTGGLNPRTYSSPNAGLSKDGNGDEYEGGNAPTSTGQDWARIRKDYWLPWQVLRGIT
jgi:hypothetical protein